MNNNEFKQDNNQQIVSIERKNTNVIAVLGLIFAFFLPFLGLILSIVGLVQAKKLENGKGLAIGGIIVSAILFILEVILFVAVFILAVISDSPEYDWEYYDEYAYREAFKVNGKVNIKEEMLPTFNRHGFVAGEWVE